MKAPQRLTSDLFNPRVRARLSKWRTVEPSGCWIWQRSKNEAGYGTIRIGSYDNWLERVHRVSYAIFVAPVEPGMRILHRCDNPPCFNPDHLFQGTAQDNTNDMIAKMRWKKPSPVIGERNNKAKLTHAQVIDTIDRLLAGETRTSIASRYGVTIGAISRIAVGKNWRHLTVGKGIQKSTRGVKRVG